MRPEKTGFRSNEARTDHINTLRIIVEEEAKGMKKTWAQINLLAPEFYISILAHPVCKM
jgi:hypothetical protein